MSEAILQKLEARLDRRTFLRGSALAAAALLGVAAASPVITFAQTQDKPQSDDKKKDDAGKKDQDEAKDEKPYRSEGPDG
jgi:secreted PhoX family phosphatase